MRFTDGGQPPLHPNRRGQLPTRTSSLLYFRPSILALGVPVFVNGLSNFDQSLVAALLHLKPMAVALLHLATLNHEVV